jgi:adenylyltransferase/sulfurtransferase
VLCIGAGGLVSHIAPALVRKGIGALTILDDDEVEVSNLNRQRFYAKDVGKNKALALAANLHGECIHDTRLTGYALRLDQAIAAGVDLYCNVAVCGVDNNPTRVLASRHFRDRAIPAIFTAVSADADHGYVFVQQRTGACYGCLFPDVADDSKYPCPGTPAIGDILQLIGAITAYAVDTALTGRGRDWNYRRISLHAAQLTTSRMQQPRAGCAVCGHYDTSLTDHLDPV